MPNNGYYHAVRNCGDKLVEVKRPRISNAPIAARRPRAILKNA